MKKKELKNYTYHQTSQVLNSLSSSRFWLFKVLMSGHCDITAAAAAESLQSCPTLCDPIYGSPPGSPNPGILQARILEWVAISFSNAWKWKVEAKLLSRVRLLATPWTAAHQALPSMGFFQTRALEWGAIAFSAVTSQGFLNRNAWDGFGNESLAGGIGLVVPDTCSPVWLISWQRGNSNPPFI